MGEPLIDRIEVRKGNRRNLRPILGDSKIHGSLVMGRSTASIEHINDTEPFPSDFQHTEAAGSCR